MKVITILGSSSSNSGTRQATESLKEIIGQYSATMALLDLSIVCSSVQNMDHYEYPPDGSLTERLRSFLDKADAIVLATPVHHGSFSGLLKSGLDHLPAGAFKGKPVGVLSMGGSPRSASAACDQLRSVIRVLGGWAVPTGVGLYIGDIHDGVACQEMFQRTEMMVNEMFLFLRAKVASHRSATAR